MTGCGVFARGISIYVYMYTYIYTHVHVDVCIYIYTTYIHTYIHTGLYALRYTCCSRFGWLKDKYMRRIGIHAEALLRKLDNAGSHPKL